MGEGDGYVGEDDGGVGEDRGDDDGPRQRSGATGSKGERAPPSSSSSLTSSLDGRRVSPLVLGSHGLGGARAPSRLDLSLCLSVCLCSQILPLHRFFYIWRSVTPIGVNLLPRFSHKISFIAAKEERQPPYGWPTRVQGTPRGRAHPLSRGHLGHGFALILPPENPKYSKIILRPFLSRLDSV